MSTPGRSRGNPVAAAIVGSVFLVLLALALWVGAGAVGARECLDTGYGFAVEGGSVNMTDAGCQVTVPTRDGQVVSAPLPSRHDGLATAALVVALLAVVPPFAAHRALVRRNRDRRAGVRPS
jgi:hypothetical protein